MTTTATLQQDIDLGRATARSLRMGGKGDPRATLHHRLAISRHQRERMSTIKELHLVFRTWNAIRSGESLKQLKTLADTPFAEPQ